MNFSHTCACCGSKVTAYTVRMNRPLALAFLTLCDLRIRLGRTVRKCDLELTQSQYGNFQKLRHFGVAEMGEDRHWEVTPFGWRFLRGEVSILHPGGQMGNAAIPDDHPAWATHDGPRKLLSIWDVLPEEWRERASYIAEKRGAA